MKQKLLKTLALGLLLAGGLNGAWAKIVWPNALIQYRANAAIASATAWNSSDFPKDGKTIDKIEAGYSNYMWVVGDFIVPDMANVSSIKLALAYNGTAKDVNVFLWNNTYPGVKAAWDATFVSNVNTVISTTPIGTLSSDSSTLTINGDNLATLKTTFGNTGEVHVKFLLYIKGSSDSDKTAFYGGSAGLPSRRPHLEVGYTGVSPIKIGETAYETLSGAISAASENSEITLYDDVTLGSRLSMEKSVTIKAAENCNVSIYRFFDTAGQALIIGNTASKTILFDGSASGASLTIDDLGASKNNMYESNQNSTTTTIKNVTFRNASSGTSQVISANAGNIKLDNVTFLDCHPATSIIYAKDNDDLTLVNAPIFTDCAALPHISTGGRIKVLSPSTFNPSTAINVTTTMATNKILVLGKNSSDNGNENIDNIIGKFNVVNSELGLLKNTSSGHTNELITAQAYTLEVGEAEASTLVLPFAAAIPEDVNCYTLTYSGGSAVTASLVEITLPANTPVLVNAAQKKYKFVATTISDAVSGSAAVTFGALTGVYTETQPGEGNAYILSVKSGKLGFYKTTANSKVAPYRAYLTATVSAPSFLDFDFGGTTAIETPLTDQYARGVYYNLNGQRVEHPTRGLYIVNGKKVIVK